jgi:hypothetical protein
MKLHNRYSYGQLFCYSGLDGATSRSDDFVAMMMEELNALESKRLATLKRCPNARIKSMKNCIINVFPSIRKTCIR